LPKKAGCFTIKINNEKHFDDSGRPRIGFCRL
jgi:hypothetical protein